MIRAVLLSSLVLTIGVLLGRISGFIRESFIAGTFGVSSEADQIILMLTLPDLLVNLLLGGALSAVLIPLFTKNTKRAKQILFQSSVLLCVFFVGIAIVLSWQSVLFIKILAPGLSDDSIAGTAALISWSVWLIPLTVLAGATTAYLHSVNSFSVASLGTLIINLSIILGLVLVYYGYGSVYLVAVFVVLGGVFRLMSQLAVIGVRWQPIAAMTPFLLEKSFFVRYFQAVLSTGLLFLLPFLARAYASYLEPGSIATLNYGMKLVEFPLLLTVTFLSIILFPRLSQSFGVDDRLHQQLIHYGMQITMLLGVFTSLVLVLISFDYAYLVFGYGGMSEKDIQNVASIAQIGLLMLPLQGLVLFITAILHSRNVTKVPVIINFIGLLFFIGLMQLDYFTENLFSITFALVVSYAFILVLFLVVTKVDGKRVALVFLDKHFAFSLGISSLVLYVLIECILGFQIISMIKVMLAFCAGLFSLFLVLILNKNLLQMIRARSTNV